MTNELKYHHIGIPTDKQHENEEYLEDLKLYLSGFATSPYGVEWMRFEAGSPLPELIKTVPHVAFVVDDLEAAVDGKDILVAPNRISESMSIAFVIDNGAPIEFLHFDKEE